MNNISIADVINLVKGELISQTDINGKEIVEVCTDTRKIVNNCLFIPIKGENFDGHDFINIALENGAIAVLTEKDIVIPKNKIAIRVEDTRRALRDLAEGYLRTFDIPVIAVTGSVGKTSCKDMIASVLGAKFKVLKTEGNFNNDIGLPLTVFRLTNEHEIAVLEMGMNHFGEISVLSKVARPDFAVITNIGVSHIENLGSREGILKAKCEIFDYMNDRSYGLINYDDDYLPSIIGISPLNIITFGLNENADYYAKNIILKGYEGISAKINTPKDSYDIFIPSVGQHMIYNVLPAIIIAEKLGLEKNEIIKGINSFIPTKMRLNIYKVGNNITIIDDVYNASPDSMKAALSTLKSLPAEGRRVAILGDMFEMGSYAYNGHLEVGLYAKNTDLDFLICVGENSKYIKEGFGYNNSLYYRNIDQLILEIKNLLIKGDTILLKASRGMHFEKIIEEIKSMY